METSLSDQIKKGRWQCGTGIEKGKDSGRMKGLRGGVKEQVKSPGDAVRHVQGQPPIPRTPRPFRCMVFWDRWQSIPAAVLMKTQIYVVIMWMLRVIQNFDWKGYRFSECCTSSKTYPWRKKNQNGIHLEMMLHSPIWMGLSFYLHVKSEVVKGSRSMSLTYSKPLNTSS